MESCRVHLLDCGPEKYGDALLVEIDKVTILIDGAHRGDAGPKDGHPGLTAQLAERLGQQAASLRVTLIVVTHAHDDHIGCLPALVEAGLTADHALVVDPDLGWGREVGDSDAPRGRDERTRHVLAGLREEPWEPSAVGPGLDQFLADAAGLEERYRAMLATLKKRKTRVVRHGRDKPTAMLAALKKQGVTVRILGPSQAQLLAAAAKIGGDSDAWASDLDAAFAADAGVTAADAYRRLADEVDAGSRLGHMVNLQSIVLGIEAGGRRLLLTGDMQFTDPQTGDPAIVAEVEAMIARVSKRAPYDFVKLAHHGSWNGIDDTLLDALSPAVVGICAGEHSTHHPSREVLGWLKARKQDLTWARTDRQGAVTIDLTDATPTFDPDQGLNDARPNDGGDQPLVAPPAPVVPRPPPAVVAPVAPAPVAPPAAVVVERSDGDVVEVIARIPLRNVRVTLSIDVSVPGAPPSPEPRPRGDETAAGPGRLLIGDGRPLPPLLFVTDRDRLAVRITADAADEVIAALRATPGAVVVADAGGGAAQQIRERLARERGSTVGVVLVGGYDVVPSQVVDALPPRIRAEVGEFHDHDDFVVWSDDIYGAVDDDAIPDVPVSRVPDCGSAAFLRRALAPRAPSLGTRASVRNHRRPFAVRVYREDMPELAGQREPEASVPRGRAGIPQLEAADALYLMLHGEARSGRSFLGEDEAGEVVEAVNLDALPGAWAGTVFAGCCWGALPVSRPASDQVPGAALSSRTPADSLALAFLARGATAFVGCTGSHYSPTIAPYEYFGKPLHSAFWKQMSRHKSAAEALLLAKRDYVAGLPHQLPNNRRTPAGIAIEYKTWRQFTCLGLGW